MPALKVPKEYLTFTQYQSVQFLKEIDKIVKDLLNLKLNNEEKANEKFESLQKLPVTEKYEKYRKTINESNSPISDKYLSAESYLYGISNSKGCYGIPLENIQGFLNKFFPNHDFRNFKKGAKDLGTIEELFAWQIRERNNPKNINPKESPPIENSTNLSQKVQDVYKAQLEQNDYALYTYGEKVLDDTEGGSLTRIFYIKERPVRFENKKIILKNTDSADIVQRKDVKNRKGIIITESNPIYEGDYQVFKRKNAKSDSILYLETDALHGGNQRHFRLILAFGKEIEEIGLGTFTLIKDFGPLLSGAALLVKKENQDDNKSYFENTKCKLYNSFTNYDDNAIPRPIRMLLEKRSRAYIKLPRALSNYTLDNLESYLFAQKKEREREKYESREVIIHRKDAFISIPLNCNGTETAKKYDALLKKSIKTLQSKPFNLTKLTYGTKKIRPIKGSSIESPDKTEEHESNFDKITQSNLVIFIFPDITFPYELEPYDPEKESNGNSIHISTAFMEMGFAIGLRKRILILTSDKVFRTFPSIVKKFAETKFVEIIKCELNSETDIAKSFKNNEQTIMIFLDAHLDYKIIEE